MLLLVAGTAHADLKPDSRNALRIGSGQHVRLAMPLPTIARDVRILKARHGRRRARIRIRYRAANWKGTKTVARDRVLVTFQVARRLLPGGPDPSNPRWRRTISHELHHRKVDRTYTVRIPRSAVARLRARGAFAKDANRRRDARRLLWVDIQQDRDFLHVDGGHDWREGNASNAAGLRSPVAKRAQGPSARAAGNDGCGSNSPCGTVTVQNQTANGVYGPASPYADASGNGAPGTLAGTANQVGMPLAVGGAALQCFYQGGVGNSNPAGFANFDAQGQPQPYLPGTVANGPGGQPVSSGTAVTQPIAADDSIALASNNQVATTSGFLTGILDEVVNFGAFALDTYSPSIGGVAMIAMGESSLPIPSPGAVVSAGLNIAEAVVSNSCDGNLNLMGFAAAEPGGGLAAASINASKEGFVPATTPVAGATSGTAGANIAGTQLNPSQSMFNGSTLYLQPDMGGGGVQGNVANSSDNQNFIDLIWTNFDPCQYPAGVNQVEQTNGNCRVTPVPSPTVSSDTGDVNCGTGNAQCPFPAAGFPAGAATLPTTPLGVTAPAQPPATTLGVNECATVMAAGDALPSGQSISSPSGRFVLTMQANGTLALSQSESQTPLWSASGPPVAGAFAAMQTAGSLAVVSPPTTVAYTTSTTTTGTPYLAVQNDGNLVVYDSATGDAVWASNTQVATCSTPGPSSAATSTTPVTTTSATGCATLLAAGSTQYLPGTTIQSPNGQYTLQFGGAAILYPTAQGAGQATWSSTLPYQPPPAAIGAGVPDDSTENYLVLQTDGNLVIWYPGPGLYSPPGTDGPSVAFQTNTSGNAGASLAVQNDGNLVLYAQDGSVLWASNTATGTPCPPV